MTQAKPSWRRLERQAVRWALILALFKTGRRRAARIAIVAITVSSSMRVNPRTLDVCREFVIANAMVIAGIRLGIYLTGPVPCNSYFWLFSPILAGGDPADLGVGSPDQEQPNNRPPRWGTQAQPPTN